MKLIIKPCLVALMGLLFMPGILSARELPDFTDIVEKNSSAVVKIRTITNNKNPLQQYGVPDRYGQEVPEIFRYFFDAPPQQSRPRQSLGSGFFISSDGYLLTNNHVVGDADEIVVQMADRREYAAELVGLDSRSDLALLKVNDTGLPYLKLAERDKELQVGEWVLAIGSPFGLDYSVTAGIVSAKGRSLPNERNENYVPFIQTDVAINPGNSGGPLFDMDGEVVGVNSQIYTRSGGSIGLSFAIPVQVVVDVVGQLKQEGEVKRGWLGVGIQDVDLKLAKAYGLEKPSGALVSHLEIDGPAEKAGLQLGDIILEFDGRKVTESSDLPHIVGLVRPGTKAIAKVLRDGSEKDIKVKVGELAGEKTKKPRLAKNDRETGYDNLGLRVAELESDNDNHDERDINGVRVVAVKPGSPADQAGLRRGDVITLLDSRRTANKADYHKVVRDLSPGLVPIRVIRSGVAIFKAIDAP